MLLVGSASRVESLSYPLCRGSRYMDQDVESGFFETRKRELAKLYKDRRIKYILNVGPWRPHLGQRVVPDAVTICVDGNASCS